MLKGIYLSHFEFSTDITTLALSIIHRSQYKKHLSKKSFETNEKQFTVLYFLFVDIIL